MPLILGANSASGGYTVKNSLRFNSGSSDYLSRTPSVTGNIQKWTYSVWIKRSRLSAGSGEAHQLLSASPSGSGGVEQIFLTENNVLNYFYADPSLRINLVSSAVFRDVSAWYHIVVAVDTTQATDTNRVKIYVNGSQITFSTATYPAQNQNTYINNTNLTSIGSQINNGSNNGNYFGGYQSEVYFIDGQQLTPSSFGQTDPSTPSSGIWVPKAYTGTYGTNGFYLKFANSASLGTDSSGNGNTFTVNNLTSVYQSTDTPTNNFATLNPLVNNPSTAGTASEGNLQYLTTNAGYFGSVSTMGVSQGKWYCEIKMTAKNTVQVYMVGIDGDPNNSSYNNLYAGGVSTSYGYYANDGNKWNNNSGTAYGSAYDVGDIISIAMDLDNNKLYFAKNGTWQNSGVPTSGATGTGAISISATPASGLYFFAVGDAGSAHNVTMQCNFGNPPYSANSYTDGAGYGNFSYAVPSGYYALCTKNLANFG